MNRREYPHPSVRRIEDENGSRIEPPLDPKWSHGQKLAWHAAIVEMDTGLIIRILDGQSSVKRDGRWTPDRDVYSMTINGPRLAAGLSAMDFHTAWTYINGIDIGARAAVVNLARDINEDTPPDSIVRTR